MKRISLPLITTLISIIFIFVLCSKKDKQEDTTISGTYTSGLLITTGRRVDGTFDSVLVKLGGAHMVGAWDGELARPFVGPGDYWHLVQTGSGVNRWRIETNRAAFPGAPAKSYMQFRGGVYQSFRPNFTVVPRTSDSTLFMIDWQEDQFTVRPVLDPSFFLNTGGGNTPNQTHHTHLLFTTTPQMFFLIQ